MPPRMDPKKKKQMLEWYEDGVPQSQIAKRLGMEYTAVRTAVARARKKGVVGTGKKGPKPKPEGEAVYKDIRTVIFLDDETHKLLKLAALYEGKSMSVIARDALQKHLKGMKDKAPLFFG